MQKNYVWFNISLCHLYIREQYRFELYPWNLNAEIFFVVLMTRLRRKCCSQTASCFRMGMLRWIVVGLLAPFCSEKIYIGNMELSDHGILLGIHRFELPWNLNAEIFFGVLMTQLMRKCCSKTASCFRMSMLRWIIVGCYSSFLFPRK